MKSRLLDDNNGQRTYVLVFDTGDEVKRGLLDFANDNGVDAGHFTAIGAFQDAKLGYYDWDAKQIVTNHLPEQVEVVSFIGNFARSPEGDPQFHAHVAVARRDGSVWGGHLLSAIVRPLLEVVVIESPAHLHRVYERTTGMAMISLD